MPVLNLGVIEVGYTYDGGGGKAGKGKVKKGPGKKVRRAAAAKGSATTTTQVARILEEKYGVMQAFVDLHHGDIERDLIDGLNGALEGIYSGSPVTDPFADATTNIESLFRLFLMTGEIEGMGISGVPTKAALDRKSSRFKKGKANGPRPSFIDTGIYEAAFKAWMEK